MSGSKMPTEKARRDGSPVRRGHPDVVKKNSNGTQMGDCPVSHESRSSSGMPVKMLISQEMSREAETGRNSPNVVAKLMGLDSLPVQPLAPVSSIIIPKGRTKNSYTIGEAILGRQSPQESAYLEEMISHHDIQPFHNHVDAQIEYKDIYEVWKQPSRINSLKDESPLTERYNDYPREKRMALVHQKFMEAKRLAMNQNLLRSKEFQDALEVLSSNKEIFLKFLEEPNLQFSRHLHERQTAIPSCRRQCITLLKPSKTLNMTSEKQLKKEILAEVNGCSVNKLSQSSGHSYLKSGSLSQLTRIVVLKPSPRKSHELKDVLTFPTLPQRPLKGKEFFEELGSVETRRSREVAKEITWQMRESVSNRKDETLLFSALSNGYTGDESSFSRSEIVYMEEECGNFSDSQAMTPTSQCSWDYVNRYGSPYSPSSYSRASYLTESSLTIEAKKRLSDRLAMVTSNGGSQDHKQLRRSSSTLGEMLLVSETMKEQGVTEESSISSGRVCTDNDGLKTTSCSFSNRTHVENNGEKSPMSLQRSKSVPVSSSACNTQNLGMGVSDSHGGESVPLEGITKSKSLKFSFKEKVSSFFSRIKKPKEEKFIPPASLCSHDKVAPSSISSIAKKSNDISQIVDNCRPEEEPTPSVGESLNKKSSTLEHHFLKQGPYFAKEDLSLEKTSLAENSRENMEQPSPVSVLEAVFDEDSSSSSSQCRDAASSMECHRTISRSALIDTVACSLSWDENTSSDGNTANPENHPIVSPEVDVQEQERLDFVKSILQSSGLVHETPSTAQAKWYSPEMPLNPSLLDKFVERKEEGAKCRERRSSQKLLFDCVNAALLEISQTDVPDLHTSLTTNFRICNVSPANNTVINEVSLRVTRWFSGAKEQATGPIDNTSSAIDYVIKKEVNGRGWEEKMCSEITSIEREIEGDVIDELVGEALDGLIMSAYSVGIFFPYSCI